MTKKNTKDMKYSVV